jgi:hypothetical protein
VIFGVSEAIDPKFNAVLGGLAIAVQKIAEVDLEK